MSDITLRLPQRPSTPEARARGGELRTRRERSGLSMGDLARVYNCSVVRISDIERGLAEPTDREVSDWPGT